jgi:phosphatidylinositol kinase/protein kinase (PI-3  family)
MAISVSRLGLRGDTTEPSDTPAASWDLFSCIVKTGGDLRQEQLATHLIQAFRKIWIEEGCQCWVR